MFDNGLFILMFIISTILTVKLFSNVDVARTPTILAQAAGSIERGNFSYFYVHHNHGPMILNLTSLLGDADLYISDSSIYPTYESYSYSLHSATCGDDVIEIKDSLETPLAVGVYGHAETSVYLFEILENPEVQFPYKQWATILRESEAVNKETKEEISGSYTNTVNDYVKVNTPRAPKKKKTKANSNGVAGILSLLDILRLIFI